MIPFPIMNTYGNIIPNTKKIKDVQTNVGAATLVLYESGELYGWGVNSQYQLGLGTTAAVTTPTLLMTNVDEMWVGVQDTLLRTKDNHMYCAGNGYLFDSSNVSRSTFTDVSSYFNTIGISNIKKIDVGGSCLAVLTKSNQLYVCGYNLYAAYATSTSTRYATPTLYLTPCYDIKSNFDYALFTLRSDSKIYAQGLNSQYQLGSTTSPQINVVAYSPYTFTFPQTSLDNVVYTNRSGTFINTSTNTNGQNDSNRLRISGSNNSGALSIGSTSAGPYSGFSSSNTMPSGVNGSTILQSYDSKSNYVSPMLRTSTGIYVCGYGAYGSLGNGSTSNVLQYTRNNALDSIVQDYSKITALSIGFYATYLVYDNKLYACGGGGASNVQTELPGYTSLQTSFVPISLPLDTK